MKKRIIGIAILSALLFISLIFVLWQSEQKSTATKAAIRTSGFIHQGLAEALIDISQADAITRNFIITENPELEKKVHELHKGILKKFQFVIPLTEDRQFKEKLNEVLLLAGQKIQLNEDLIVMYRQAATNPNWKPKLEKSRKVLNELNILFDQLHVREVYLNTVEIQRLDDERLFWDGLVVLLGIVFLLIIGVVLKSTLNDFQKLKRIQAVHKLMVNNIRNGVVMIDLDNRLVSFNDTFASCAIAHSEKSPAVGDNASRFFPKSSLGIIEHCIEKAREGFKCKELICIGEGNDVRWFTFSFFPIEINNAILYINIVTHEITESRNREIELQRFRNKTKALLESTHEAIFLLKPDGEIEMMNTQAPKLLMQLFGRKVKIGQCLMDFFAPEGREVIQRDLQSAMEGQRIRAEYPIKVNGNLMWFLLMISPVKEEDGSIKGVSVITIDVTSRKQAEKALTKSESALRALIESMQDPFIMIRKDYTVDISNGPARLLIEALSGKPFEENMNLLGAITEEEQKRAIAYVNRCLEGETFDILESRIDDKNELWLQQFWGPVYNNKGEIYACSLLVVDVTKELQRQKELKEAKEAAERAERLQQQFLANMSHEIRTPLNGIVGMANLLAKTKLNATQQHYMNVVRYSSDNLLVLINDILDLSKIKAGKFIIEEVKFNIYELLKNASANFNVRAREKGLDFSIQVNKYIPKALVGDPHRLVQILNNLLGNALKFTEKGFIKLETQFIEGNSDQVLLEFTVTDSGIGIAEKQLATIFEAFAQEEGSVSKRFGGTGLGLTICKHLVEMQGGSMSVTSEKGVGSCFKFVLSYKVADEQVSIELAPGQEIKTSSSKPDYSGRRVLIVEDNEINQQVLSLNLQQFNIEVECASDGLEAVELLSKDNRFDLILLDLRMPQMDGTEVLKVIRGQFKMKVPVVVLTASVLKNERAECMELGADDYMAKPFSQPQLENCLAQYLPKGDTVHPESNIPAMPQPELISYSYDNLIALNDKKTVSMLLEQFTSSVPVCLENLIELAETQDWPAIGQKVHKLKSSFGIVYMDEIFSLLQEVEIAIRIDNVYDDIPAKLCRAKMLYDEHFPSIEEEIRERLLEEKQAV